MPVKFASPDSWVLGIDDTDMPGIGGTGSLARRLAGELEAMGLCRVEGVTRHQFYEGPGVPKTSRNSAAAIAVSRVGASDRLFAAACEVVAAESIPGSDPGVGMGRLPLDPALLVFGRSAQRGLVTQSVARRLAGTAGVDLVGLGGTDDGVIGALGAVALRIDGNDGRFVGLPGIRDVLGVVTVAEVLDLTAIDAVVDVADGELLDSSVEVDLGDWVRPRLIAGRPVLVAGRDGERWVNADSRPT